MHGGYISDVNGGRTEEVIVASQRRPYKSGRRKDTRLKNTSVVCQFILEDIVCKYGFVGKVVVDRGELNSNEA